MLHLYDRATMAHGPTLDLDPTLHRLLSERIRALGENLIDWTEYLVVVPGDTEADMIRHIGFTPLTNPIDDKRFGQPGFHEHWDWLVDHGGWFEMVFTFGSTFAYVLFIEDAERMLSDLLHLCHEFCR